MTVRVSFPLAAFLLVELPSSCSPRSLVRSFSSVPCCAGAYEEQPFGMCSQLFKTGKKPKNVTDFLRRGWRGQFRPFLSAIAFYLPQLLLCVIL